MRKIWRVGQRYPTWVREPGDHQRGSLKPLLGAIAIYAAIMLLSYSASEWRKNERAAKVKAKNEARFARYRR